MRDREIGPRLLSRLLRAQRTAIALFRGLLRPSGWCWMWGHLFKAKRVRRFSKFGGPGSTFNRFIAPSGNEWVVQPTTFITTPPPARVPQALTDVRHRCPLCVFPWLPLRRSGAQQAADPICCFPVQIICSIANFSRWNEAPIFAHVYQKSISWWTQSQSRACLMV